MSHEIKIGDRHIGAGHPCLVIAEVGINHNGDPEIAMRMIDAIAEAGADCVKFQTFTADEFCNNPDDIYEYVSQGENVRESMLDMFKRLEISYDHFSSFFDHARKRGLLPLSTPTDPSAVDLLEKIGSEAYKIGSDDLVYTPFLNYVAKKGKPVIFSTGMGNVLDIERAVKTIRDTGNEEIIILHCVSQYPAEDQDLNLQKMVAIRKHFGLEVGFSDHSMGVQAAASAVAMGARVIEKHFTLDRNMPGPDHRFSTNPEELVELVSAVRKVEIMMGSGKIEPTAKENEMAQLARRSIVAARDLKAGQRLAEDDVNYQRPGTGLAPYEIYGLIDKKLQVNISAGTMLTLDQFVW